MENAPKSIYVNKYTIDLIRLWVIDISLTDGSFPGTLKENREMCLRRAPVLFIVT